MKEVGKKNIIPEATGVRKGNIFVQSSDSKEQADKRLGEESICSLCESEDSFRQSRGALWKLLKRYEIKKQMIRRLEYIYEDMEVMVRTSRNLIKKFQTRRGVRQDCVLSPLLFNLYIANLDRELKNRNIGGVAIDIIGRYKDMELSVQTI